MFYRKEGGAVELFLVLRDKHGNDGTFMLLYGERETQGLQRRIE